MVAVANPYGAEAGAKVLEQGGNAIDAAVAIAFALNVVEPQPAGIGGSGFMMVHLAAEYFCPGGQAIPAGTVVTNKPLAETFRLLAAHGADCFYKLDLAKGCDIAQGIVEGQKWNRPQAAGGRGGSMTYADLEAYQPAVRPVVEGTSRGYKIKSMGPPSSGALTVIQILKMLERFPLGDASKGFGFGSVHTLNVMADAMRLAFAGRGVWMSDADFANVPVRALINPAYLAVRGSAITPGVRLLPATLTSADPRPYDVAGMTPARRLAVAEPDPSTDNGTTHFSVVDKWGNVVSYTNTIESGYGIGVFAGYTQPDGGFRNHGFLLNNELTDFNTALTTNPWTGEPGYNDVQPGKRPRSSMAPTMLFSPDGQPLLAYGSPGGATIINSVVNITVNLVDHGMTLQQAIDAGRISAAGAGSGLTLETNRLPATAADGLRALGYTVNPGDVGSVQAVLIEPRTGKQYGGADDRREGTVIGVPRPRGR